MEYPRADPSPRADLRGLRVLVTDDNATNRRVLREQLKNWGVESSSAENGPRALEELRRAAGSGEGYDLAILDMQMPDMDGMQLARAITGDPDLHPTRLVMLTSVGDRGDGVKARAAGLAAYLTKLVKQSELYDCIATVMGEAAEGAEIPERRTPLVTHHSFKEQQAGSRARLLVAEDNPVNQQVAVRMLQKLGYRADVVADGEEALRALDRGGAPYAAVLMDVQMPGMDGYQATAEIRRRERERGGRGGRLPVIAMTANAMRGDREKALAAGMDDYVAKPAKPEDLDAVLACWVSPPRARQGSNGSHDAIDRTMLEGLRDLQEEGEPDILTELATMFLSDASARLERLREAIEAGDERSVERTAHALKGSAENMGALRMAGICQEFQETGRSGDLFSRAAELLDRLEAEFCRVSGELRQKVAAD